MKRIKILIVLLCTASLLGNLYYLTHRQKDVATVPTKSPSPSDLPLLSPRIFAENQNDIIINFMSLRSQLKADASSFPFPVGLYFEYLPSGTSIGIHEKDEFAIASLLKVPLVMASYQAVRDNLFTLSDPLTIRQNDLDDGFGDLYKQGVGAKITLEEAMRLSLVTSDNTAKNVLVNSMPPKYLEDVFDSLDISKDLSTDKKQIVITPKGYASILRSLYLASYLPKEESNQILTWLTQTPFNDKIVAGVPSDIKVAHKIGSFETRDNKNDVFTDCGIVYVPKRPYILCIMTQATEEQARNAIQFISDHIYQYVNTANHVRKDN